MGIACDQEIMQMIGSEDVYMEKFANTLEECHTLQIYSQNQALK